MTTTMMISQSIAIVFVWAVVFYLNSKQIESVMKRMHNLELSLLEQAGRNSKRAMDFSERIEFHKRNIEELRQYIERLLPIDSNKAGEK